MELNEKLIDGLTDEEMEFLALQQEKVLENVIFSIKVYSAEADAIKELNPVFRGKTLNQLNDDKDFQQALKEYRDKHSLTTNPKILEMMLNLKSIIPKKHIKPNNKLANKITKDIVGGGEFDLVVSGKKAKREVSTKVMLYYDENKVKLSGREKFMPYDREVHDGIVSLYEAGNELITPAMVYRAMNGLTETEKISPQALEAVEKSLDKAMSIKIEIDYTDEAKLYNKKVEEAHYMGNLLNAGKTKVKINGEAREAYRIYRKPILYEYAQVSGQIITVPSKLLQTKDAVRSTEEVIVIRGYLLRQIEWIKNDKTARNQNVTYQGISVQLTKNQ